MDGELYEAKFPLERKDVADYFENPAYVLSGYEGHFYTVELGKGRRQLSSKVLTNDGAAHYAPGNGFFLDIEWVKKWLLRTALLRKRYLLLIRQVAELDNDHFVDHSHRLGSGPRRHLLDRLDGLGNAGQLHRARAR